MCHAHMYNVEAKGKLMMGTTLSVLKGGLGGDERGESPRLIKRFVLSQWISQCGPGQGGDLATPTIVISLMMTSS